MTLYCAKCLEPYTSCSSYHGPGFMAICGHCDMLTNFATLDELIDMYKEKIAHNQEMFVRALRLQRGDDG